MNRITGLVIIEARQSNPNGDPDQESDPRTLSGDGRGVISPVSFKRKLRDIVAADGDAMIAFREKLKLEQCGDSNKYGILESRGRDRKEIEKLDRKDFVSRFWDARVFGNTFLESMKDASAEEKKRDISHFIATGAVQFGVGVSIAPVEIDRLTNTNKSGVQEGKDRGMAPLAFRVVRHGLYAMPFFVNPAIARQNGTTMQDIELLKSLIPHAYTQTASMIRNNVQVLHAWCAEHKSPLGSCPDHKIIDALTPQLKKGQAPVGIDGYDIPSLENFPVETKERLQSLVDLCETSFD